MERKYLNKYNFLLLVLYVASMLLFIKRKTFMTLRIDSTNGFQEKIFAIKFRDYERSFQILFTSNVFTVIVFSLCAFFRL